MFKVIASVEITDYRSGEIAGEYEKELLIETGKELSESDLNQLVEDLYDDIYDEWHWGASVSIKQEEDKRIYISCADDDEGCGGYISFKREEVAA